LAVTQHAMAAEALSTQELRTLSGERLVKLLLDEKTRTEAYYELCRRHNPKKWKDSKEFFKYEFNQIAEVIVCPQGNERQPLYAVQNKWDTIANNQRGQMSSATKLLWFPKNHLKKRQGPVVFFTVEGKQVSPYNYDPDILDGFMEDFHFFQII
jgi:hypothetical protein